MNAYHVFGYFCDGLHVFGSGTKVRTRTVATSERIEQLAESMEQADSLMAHEGPRDR
jgi:hypothetical protein